MSNPHIFPSQNENATEDTISNILRENTDLRTKLDTIKKTRAKKAYKDILDYFAQNDDTLAGRVAKALDVPDEAFEASSPREAGKL